jgi:uncharacterized protein (TIGR02757 family)
MNLSSGAIHELLELKYRQYHTPDFIENDPVSIPHKFNTKEDIEIAAFFAATIAWGQRKTIVYNASRLMNMMNNEPYDFIMNSREKDLKKLDGFVHRTFNNSDCLYFVASLKNIYLHWGGLQNVFEKGYEKDQTIKSAIIYFREKFFELPYLKRTAKHISNVEQNSAAKRINMFLRWMVRYDEGLVDFGLWKGIPTAALHIPLDLHTGNTARKLRLLTRKQDDWKAVEELTGVLRKFDKQDPVKYDYALFGMGIYEGKI